MKRMTELLCMLLLTATMWVCPAFAETGFVDDVDAINQAAKSVLMLEVCNAGGSCFATGSGFVAFDSGKLVTNYHVIEGGSYVIANTDDGEKYRVSTVLCSNKALDVAILAFDDQPGLSPLELYCGDDLQRGESVLAIGSPIGIKNTVSKGNISSLYDEAGEPYIQFTAPITHGSSGGALFSDGGQVIGITSATYTNGQNMNLAIRSVVVQAMLNCWDGKTHPISAAPLSSPADYSTVKTEETQKISRLSDSVQWTCPKCANVNTSLFCLQCGTQRPVWVCRCGQENAAPFCGKCGESVECLIAEFNGAYADMASGNYADALAKFEALGAFDSESCETDAGKNARAADNITVCHYAWGKQLLADGSNEEAVSQFQIAGETYLDSAERIREAWYRQAEKLLAEGNEEEAIADFGNAGSYSDATKQILKIYYDRAERLLSEKDYGGASAAFEAAGNYSDAAERILEPYYIQAEALLTEKKYDEATAAFGKAGSYKDAEERILKIHYDRAETLLTEKDYDGASAAFAAAGDYSDAAERILEPYYIQAEALLSEKDYGGASAAFAKAGNYKDAASRVNEPYYVQAQALLAEGKNGEAAEAFLKAGNYSDAANQAGKIRYDQAEALLASGDEAGAAAAFLKAGDYEDAVSRGNELYYNLGTQYAKAKDYENAISAFAAIDGYNDAHAKWQDAVYKQASVLLKAKDYEGAYDLYVQILDYKDVAKTIKNNKNLKAVRFEKIEKLGIKAGSYVIFGNYYQSNDQEKEPIEWLVLEVDDDKALLISRYGLDAKPYNTKETNVTWENCTLRKWLNNEFMNEAFTVEEQEYIQETTVDNSKKQHYDWIKNFLALGAKKSSTTYKNYKNTKDKMFLLSCTEANKYFGVEFKKEENLNSRGEPTEYAIKQGADTNSNYLTSNGKAAGIWWLRSPGAGAQLASEVNVNGALANAVVNNATYIVRPALWLNTDSLVYSFQVNREKTYQNALSLQQGGQYEKAISAFESIGGYHDSTEQIRETKYLQAKSLYVAGNKTEAYAIFDEIPGYKDVDSIIASDDFSAIAERAKYNVGKTVTLGSYGDEAIEWVVLDEQGDGRLLICKYILEAKPYNMEDASVTWETCSLRQWLNNDFFNEVFDDEMQRAILLTAVDNSMNQYKPPYSVDGGNNTQDQMFLLSYAEAKKYFAENRERKCVPTDQALKNGAQTYEIDGEAIGWWWLRSPDDFGDNYASCVFHDGSLGGSYVYCTSVGVRPAMWIDLNAMPQ